MKRQKSNSAESTGLGVDCCLRYAQDDRVDSRSVLYQLLVAARITAGLSLLGIAWLEQARQRSRFRETGSLAALIRMFNCRFNSANTLLDDES